MKTQKDFQLMLGVYIDKYRGKSVTYLDFRLTFNEWLTANYPPADAQKAIDMVDWNAWVLSPGGNPVQLNFTTVNATIFANLAQEYVTLGGSASPVNFQAYLTTDNPNLKVVFLDTLVSLSAQVNPKILGRIDQDLKVTNDINPEIGQRWYPLSIS